jgi:hypothetical protein
MTDTLNHALALAAQGRHVFPMSLAKRPANSNGVKGATRDPAALRAWFTRPGLIPAIATGEPSGIVALDVDAQHGGLAWLAQTRDRLPETEIYETKSGGQHWIFEHRPGLPTIGLNRIGAGVELRSTGASAIDWRAIGLPRISDAPPAPFPEWLLPPAPKHRDPAPPRVPDDACLSNLLRFASQAPAGERNRRLYWAGCRLGEQVRHGTLSPGYAIALIEAAGVQAGLPRAEAKATAQSAIHGGRA